MKMQLNYLLKWNLFLFPSIKKSNLNSTNLIDCFYIASSSELDHEKFIKILIQKILSTITLMKQKEFLKLINIVVNSNFNYPYDIFCSNSQAIISEILNQINNIQINCDSFAKYLFLTRISYIIRQIRTARDVLIKGDWTKSKTTISYLSNYESNNLFMFSRF